MVSEKEKDRDARLVAQCGLKVIEKFGQYLGKTDVELQALVTFLVVAEKQGDFPMQDLQDIIGMSQSSVSRNVSLLSIGAKVQEGNRVVFTNPRLIEAFEDPEYRRRKHVRLTTRGRKLMEEMKEIFATYAKKVGG